MISPSSVFLLPIFDIKYSRYPHLVTPMLLCNSSHYHYGSQAVVVMIIW